VTDELPVLLLIVPLAGAVLSALGQYWRRFPLAETSALLALGACLALLVPPAPAVLVMAETIVYELGGWSEPVGIALYLDGLAWTSSLLGLVVGLCALLFAVAEGKHGPRFYFFFLMLVFGMQGVILTGDLFNLLVFLEILSMASYVLIAAADRPRALVASFRYLMISSLGIAFLLLGILLLYQAAGTLSLRSLGETLRARGSGQGGLPTRSLQLAVVCLVVGAGVKAAFIPFHTWLPEAHASAPHPVSAVLSGVMIKVSFLVVWRLLAVFAVAELQRVLLWVGGATAVFGVAAAICQEDSKRLLAFSSISQMGYIVAAFGAGSAAALGASLYHLVNHSLFKSLLFLTIGAVVHVTGERDIFRLRRLGALAGRLPGLFALFLVGALSIAGLPPFNGYVSKGLITAELQRWPAAYALILLAGAGTVASFLKLSGVFLPLGHASPGGRGSSRGVPPLMFVPMALLALLCLVTGVLPRLIGGALQAVAGASPLFETPAAHPIDLYGGTHLLELAATLGVGVGLYFLAVRTRLGERVLVRLRGLRIGLGGALALLVLGLVVLTALSWLLRKL
jgi:formate hydrogenlyase subunit 3/multisubunit Na+/H+ antiporter MnhD subunit